MLYLELTHPLLPKQQKEQRVEMVFVEINSYNHVFLNIGMVHVLLLVFDLIMNLKYMKSIAHFMTLVLFLEIPS